MKNYDKEEINVADLFFEFQSDTNLNKESIRNIKNDYDLDLLSKIYKHGNSEQRFIENIAKLNINFDKKKLDDLRKIGASRILKTLNILNYFYKIIQKLNNQDVLYVPLKGLQLLCFHKCDPSLRPIRDIDLLVRKEDLKKIILILHKLGFYFKNNKNIRADSYQNLPINKYDLEPLYNDDGICIELHIRIFKNNDCLLTDYLLKNISNTQINNLAIPKINMESLAIHLIYHASSKQGFDVGVQVLFDLEVLINNNNFNYKLFLELANKFNLVEEVSIFLRIIHQRKIIKIEKRFFKELIEFNDIHTSIAERLIVYNKASNASISYYKNGFMNLFNRNFKKSYISDEIFYNDKIYYFIKAFFIRISRNTFKYLNILLLIILDKNFRSDNKNTILIMELLKNDK